MVADFYFHYCSYHSGHKCVNNLINFLFVMLRDLFILYIMPVEGFTARDYEYL